MAHAGKSPDGEMVGGGGQAMESGHGGSRGGGGTVRRIYPSSAPSAVDHGGDGGDHGGMDDARLVKIETKLDHIEKEVGQVKWWIVAQIAAGFITVVGTGIAIQQMTVATFQAAAGQPAPAATPPVIINVPTAPAPPTQATPPPR